MIEAGDFLSKTAKFQTSAIEVPPNQFELAKWIAVIAMALDHFGKIVMPDYFMVGHFFGRLAFPLFAWIIACRLAANPELARRYLVWMLPFALLAQPIFVFAGQDIWNGNIFFTLALGVIGVGLLQQRSKVSLVWIGLAATLVLGLSIFVDYGPPGVALIVLLHVLARGNVMRSALWLGPLAVLVNISWGSLLFTVAGTAALFSSVAAAGTLYYPFHIPRLPKWAFYGFYPAHLLFFTLIAIYFFEA
jgi:hypothetical protein